MHHWIWARSRATWTGTFLLLLLVLFNGDGLLATETAPHHELESQQQDQDPPFVWIDNVSDGALVRTPHLTITGGAFDPDSGVASVACNGAGATFTDGAYSCAVDLVVGPNTITVQATDRASNTTSTSIAVTFDDTLSVHVDTPTYVPAATLATLWGQALGPDDKPRTYSWTQVDGPTVSLLGADTANVSFLTPADDVTLTLQLTVSNSVATVTAQTEVHVQSFATSLHIQPQPGEGHESSLTVASTSLQGGSLWRATDTDFVVSLSAEDGAVLDPTSENGTLTVYLDTQDDIHDVTAWFTYDSTQQTVTLQPAHLSDFRDLLLTTNIMELQIVGVDSLARIVSLEVPFMYAKFQIHGTLTAPAGTPADALQQTLVLLEGGDRQYRAATTPASDGSFAFDAVVGDTYTITAVAPGDLFGTSFVRFDSTTSNLATVSLNLLAPPSTPSQAGAGGARISMMSDELGAFAYASPPDGFSQALLRLPQGTKTVHLTANAGASGFDEAYWFQYDSHPDYPCRVAAAITSFRYPYFDTQYSYGILLAGRLIASGTGSICNTADGRLLDLQLDVAAATAEHDVDVLLVAVTDTNLTEFGVYGSVIAAAAIDNDLTLLSVEDIDGTAHVKRLSEVPPKKKGQMVKLMGVPQATKQTANRWGMRIRYRPIDATIQHIRVIAQNLGGPIEDLSFSQVPDTPKGVIELSDVGFDVYGGGPSRPMWDAKADDAFVVVEIQAQLADGTNVTKTATLGLDVANHRKGFVLAPLYDAGDIPGAIRFGTSREQNWGYDGWGTDDSFSFLQQHPALSFNDLSLEHGGPFAPHHSHQRGTSIDLRYLGPNGPEDPLNGSNVTTRVNTWAAARHGDLVALRTMITWIQMNRAGMDALFDGGGIRVIYIDPAVWHSNPILHGTFGNGAQIIDPDTHEWIGAWSPHGRVQTVAPHLDHFHVERFVRTWGNPAP